MISFNQIWIYIVFMVLSVIGLFLVKEMPHINNYLSLFNVVLIFGILFDGAFAFWCILGTGLFFSVGWSNIFALSIRGSETRQVSDPLSWSWLLSEAQFFRHSMKIIDEHGVQLSFIIPLVAVLFLVYFGFNRYKSN